MIYTCEQGSPEWVALRCGKATASRLSDIMSKRKDGSEAAGRKNYRAELVCERLTGRPCDQYVTDDMRRGTELEPVARAEYEIREDVMVEVVGFVEHATIPMFGASPDGLIGDRGGLEIKVPKVATHIEWLLGNDIPPEHRGQLVANLSCTEREWWDFVSYCPDLPPNLQFFKRRMIADGFAIEMAESEVRKFLSEVDDLLVQLGQVEAVNQ
jgi:hypothetical protein